MGRFNMVYLGRKYKMGLAMNDAVKEFWNDQAAQYGASDLATAPDHYYRMLEIERIKAQIPAKTTTLLDIGCGNGYSTAEFAKLIPHATVLGLDYSPEMIRRAHPMITDKLHFAVGDIREPYQPLAYGKFQVIVSERCLINLAHWQEQQAALLRMRKALQPDGIIILVENTLSGLSNLNNLRAMFDLLPIQVRWHNCYLPDEIDDFLLDNFYVRHAENIGNLFYIISRVVYAAICAKQGVEPDYRDIHNLIASKLPSLGDYNYSPNRLWVLSALP